jgi:hypothetical protein
MPYLLPQHFLSEEHAFEGFDALIELIDRTSAKTGLHSAIIIKASDIKSDALRAWLSAIAPRLLFATRLAGWYIVPGLGRVWQFVTVWPTAAFVIRLRWHL